MKGILKRDFTLLDVTGDTGIVTIEHYEQDSNLIFKEGDEVLILKVIENAEKFDSGIAFVIFNEETLESMTIDSSFITVINKEFDFGEPVGRELF